jgi:hypothetical protein
LPFDQRTEDVLPGIGREKICAVCDLKPDRLVGGGVVANCVEDLDKPCRGPGSQRKARPGAWIAAEVFQRKAQLAAERSSPPERIGYDTHALVSHPQVEPDGEELFHLSYSFGHVLILT